jgi:magnesium chelatase family protein
LREPLESGRITISRAARQADFPARFQLVAAMNPCACGYLGHPGGGCRCSPDKVNQYRGRISGPLLDRIDMHVDVPAIAERHLLAAPAGESSRAVRKRVAAAWAVQRRRQGAWNCRLQDGELERRAGLRVDALDTLRKAVSHHGLSARACHRVIRVARTIADLGRSQAVLAVHIDEALGYRGHQSVSQASSL